MGKTPKNRLWTRFSAVLTACCALARVGMHAEKGTNSQDLDVGHGHNLYANVTVVPAQRPHTTESTADTANASFVVASHTWPSSPRPAQSPRGHASRGLPLAPNATPTRHTTPSGPPPPSPTHPARRRSAPPTRAPTAPAEPLPAQPGHTGAPPAHPRPRAARREHGYPARASRVPLALSGPTRGPSRPKKGSRGKPPTPALPPLGVKK